MARPKDEDRTKHGVPREGEVAGPLAPVDAHGDAFRLDAPLEDDKEPEKPLTDAGGPFAFNREGTVEDKEAVKERTKLHPTFPVRMKQGYFPKDGGKKIPRGTELELPIEEARYLIEADLAERADDLPDTKGGKERGMQESKPEQDELYAEFLTWKARTARDRRN